MNYWLLKSEPTVYSFDQLLKEKSTVWDGIRNYAARLNLLAMKQGDLAFFYHSNVDTAIVGIAEIVREAYPDPTTDDDRWVAVDVKAVKKIRRPVTLQEVKAESELKDMDLVRLGRLSTQKVSAQEWKHIMKMAGEKS